MPGQQRAWKPGGNERVEAGSSRLAAPSPMLELPTWESFPLADRQRLVRAILQAARRQVEARPTSRPLRP
jgi:hypothetical protein